ncbi:MAG: hypothetical protein KJO31_17995 [Gammaproteobacteria bacterium]|nr:hypothetical protein [Gammaproteobacteria bacterium]
MSRAVAGGGHQTPLEDVMVAMDVVDTIRHRRLIVERELDAAGRRQRLIKRLREIYTAQGIEVSDAALEAGVDALEQERFAYTPTGGGVTAFFARLYVRRRRWLKPVVAIAAVALLIWLAWFLTVGLPQSRFKAELPERIEATHTEIVAQSQSDDATMRANDLLEQAQRALRAEAFATAETVHDDLEALLRELEAAFEIRIVSRPNELSGAWRVPDVNTNARNYYLIVEAVDANGNVLQRRVRNEEDGRLYDVRKWGVRVDEATFETVAADKRDDGIIENYVLGTKSAGKLEPDYRVPTTGATITRW